MAKRRGTQQRKPVVPESEQRDVVVYWDASAVLSALFRDTHSDQAIAWSRMKGVHLLSSLAWAETHAVLARLRKEHAIADILTEAAKESLESGIWRRINIHPAWKTTTDLSRRWSLRGADLWHLSAAKTLHDELPELVLLTFDNKLKEAATGEGLGDEYR